MGGRKLCSEPPPLNLFKQVHQQRNALSEVDHMEDDKIGSPQPNADNSFLTTGVRWLPKS